MVRLYYCKTKTPKMHSRQIAVDVISKELGINSSEITILADQYGKLYLENQINLHFNISHTRDALLIGVYCDPIGVDIENIIPTKGQLVEKCFSKREKDYIYSHFERQDERFIEIWTRKESYIKWIGKGFEIQFDSFCVVEDKKIFTNSIDNYIFSVCTEKELDISKVDIIEYEFNG